MTLFDVAVALAKLLTTLVVIAGLIALAFGRERLIRHIRRDAFNEAACAIDCGCPAEVKAAVLSVPRNSAARWNACGRENCCAIEAAEIRAMADRRAP